MAMNSIFPSKIAKKIGGTPISPEHLQSPSEPVWALLISHSKGTDLSLYREKQGAQDLPSGNISIPPPQPPKIRRGP